MIVNPAFAAEKHESHDRKVATIVAADGSHVCTSDWNLVPVLLREVLHQREAA